MNELLQAVAPFLQAGGPGSAGGGSGGSGGFPLGFGILSERENEEVVPPNHWPALEYELPEPDLESVRQVLKTRLIINRAGNKDSFVSDLEVERLIALKGQVVDRMTELDGPFWGQHKLRIIRDFMLNQQGREFKPRILRSKLASLADPGTSAFYDQLIKMRERFL